MRKLKPQGQTAKVLEEVLGDPELTLIRELSQVRQDRALVIQIARLVQLSRELRSRVYTGQVTLQVGNGLLTQSVTKSGSTGDVGGPLETQRGPDRIAFSGLRMPRVIIKAVELGGTRAAQR